MSKTAYIGTAQGVAPSQVKTIYIGTGDGIKKIKKAWIGTVDGNKIWWEGEAFGDSEVVLNIMGIYTYDHVVSSDSPALNTSVIRYSLDQGKTWTVILNTLNYTFPTGAPVWDGYRWVVPLKQSYSNSKYGMFYNQNKNATGEWTQYTTLSSSWKLAKGYAFSFGYSGTTATMNIRKASDNYNSVIFSKNINSSGGFNGAATIDSIAYNDDNYFVISGHYRYTYNGRNYVRLYAQSSAFLLKLDEDAIKYYGSSTQLNRIVGNTVTTEYSSGSPSATIRVTPVFNNQFLCYLHYEYTTYAYIESDPDNHTNRGPKYQSASIRLIEPTDPGTGLLSINNVQFNSNTSGYYMPNGGTDTSWFTSYDGSSVPASQAVSLRVITFNPNLGTYSHFIGNRLYLGQGLPKGTNYRPMPYYITAPNSAQTWDIASTINKNFIGGDSKNLYYINVTSQKYESTIYSNFTEEFNYFSVQNNNVTTLSSYTTPFPSQQAQYASYYGFMF